MIEFTQQSNEKGKDIKRPGAWYPWERCIYGGSHTEAWICLEECNIVPLCISRRFGKEVCKLLRATATEKDSNNTGVGTKRKEPSSSREDTTTTTTLPRRGIHSPQEYPSVFTADEIRMVPTTKVTFLFFKNAKWEGSLKRGILQGLDNKIKYNGNTGYDELSKSFPRVAYGQIMFLNMYHEGFIFLSLYCKNLIRLNENSQPLQYSAYEQVIITMFYGNDLLIIFAGLLKHIVESKIYCTIYDIPEDVNVFSHWKFGTPDLISGDTALLSQTAVCPRKLNGANLLGHIKCTGRRLVGLTRARVQTTHYYTSECFEDYLPLAWFKQHKYLMQHNGFESRDFDATIHTIDCDLTDRVLLGSACKFPLSEDGTFNELKKLLEKPGDIMSHVYHTHYHSLTRYIHHGGDEVFSEMVNVAQNIVDNLVAKDANSHDKMTYDDDQNGMAEPVVGVTLPIKTYSVPAYHEIMVKDIHILKLLQNIVSTATYVFDGNRAQVCFLILKPGPDDPKVDESILGLGKLFNLLVAMYAEKAIAPMEGQSIEIRIVPHKKRILGDHVIVDDCHNKRYALSINVKEKNGEHQMAYCYIGGGVQYTPPHCYPIVCKHMPYAFADRLMAVLQHVGGIRHAHYWRRQNRNLKNELSASKRTHLSEVRRTSVGKCSSEMFKSTRDGMHVLRKFFNEKYSSTAMCSKCGIFYLPCKLCEL